MHNILIQRNVPINHAFGGKAVNMYDKTEKFIRSFSSMSEAANYLIDKGLLIVNLLQLDIIYQKFVVIKEKQHTVFIGNNHNISFLSWG